MKALQQTLALALGAAACGATASAQTLFSDSFETDTAANWSVYPSSANTGIAFAYDYSLDGIPSAPNSLGGTTRGVKFTANMLAPGAAAGLSMSPNGQSFAGDYALKFDLWINANGPFPGGGAGSTEFASAGIGLSGNGSLVWSGAAPANTAWFAASGEGGASQDYRAYAGTTMQADASGVYLAGTANAPRDAGNAYYTAKWPGGQTAPASQQAAFAQQTGGLNPGTIGFGWRDFEIAKQGNAITWSIDGLPIARFDAAAAGLNTSGNIAIGYLDPFASVSDNPALSFGVVDNVRVIGIIPEPSTFALAGLGLGLLGWVLRRHRTAHS